MGVDEEAVVKFLVAENPSRRQVGKSDWSDAIFWTSRSLPAATAKRILPVPPCKSFKISAI